MTAAEMLEGAADFIERKGWWKKGGGPVGNCAVAALVTMEYGVEPMARRTAYSALEKRLGVADVEGIFDWNDAEGQTAENVCRTLREVAAKLTTQEPLPPLTNRDPGDEDPNWEIREHEPILVR